MKTYKSVFQESAGLTREKIADSITRYLIGNPNKAIQDLKSAVGANDKKFDFRIPSMKAGSDYNSVYDGLVKDFIDVLYKWFPD
ncbi:MAG TPA: hypothetical protein PKX62_16475 [Spirochaetota bacterium]|nr:hypothetical protein [Bacteroidales bacterium]HQF09707.1 hypothetical protein [Spirochaetota bacterium]HRS78497.1 hypothetical protein [Spirochaetota bacterium]